MCNELKRRQKYYFRTFIFSNSQIEILLSFSRSTNVNVNMSFRNSNFEGNFSTYVFGKSFWYYRDLKSECRTSRHNLCKKILNFFICVEVRILCKKVKYVWRSQFPEDIKQICRLETTPLCLNTRLPANKNFKMQINFIEINVNVCLLCAHHVMTSIILHTRRPVNKNSLTHFVFMYQLTIIFRILRSWKARFLHTPFRRTSYVQMRLNCWSSVIV